MKKDRITHGKHPLVMVAVGLVLPYCRLSRDDCYAVTTCEWGAYRVENDFGANWSQRQVGRRAKSLKTWWPGTELNRRRQPFQFEPKPFFNQQLNSSKWPLYCDHSVTSADVRLRVGIEMFRIERHIERG